MNDLWQKQQVAQMRAVAESNQHRSEDYNARLAVRKP